MEYIHGTTKFHRDRPTAINLGKFDGFHRGHQKLIRYGVENKDPEAESLVLTFSTSPQSYLTGRPGESLATRRERLRMARDLGVDVLIELPFTEQVRRMEAKAFLREILVHRLKAQMIVVGPDCRFGYQGKGTAALLHQMAKRYGYQLVVLQKEMYRGEAISSSRIKECLHQGQIGEANAMLGYAYGVTGNVIHGKQIGRTIGVPTINQKAPAHQLMPRSGVYRAEIWVDGIRYDGMANVGRKPTIAGERPIGVETYLFDFSREIYGKPVRVNFLEFIRPEMRFDSLEALRSQIQADEVTVRQRIDEARGRSL